MLKPMIEGAEENFKAINKDGPMSEETKILADNGYYTKENMKMLEEEKRVFGEFSGQVKKGAVLGVIF